MLSKTILAISTVVLAVAASPMEVTKRTTPGQTLQQKCGNNLQASCCNSVFKEVFGLVNLNIGVACTPINLLSVLPISQQCNNQVACCETGNQSGLVNVGSVCPIVL